MRKITVAFVKEGIGFFDHFGGYHVAGVFLRQARNDNDPAAAEQQAGDAFALANRMADAIADKIRTPGQCRPRDLEKWALPEMQSPSLAAILRSGCSRKFRPMRPETFRLFARTAAIVRHGHAKRTATHDTGLTSSS